MTLISISNLLSNIHKITNIFNSPTEFNVSFNNCNGVKTSTFQCMIYEIKQVLIHALNMHISKMKRIDIKTFSKSYHENINIHIERVLFKLL